MTKLGFHVASGQRTGVGDLLKAGAALCVMVDQNMIPEARAAGAVTAFRAKRVGGDNPQGIDQAHVSNMPERAFDWLKLLAPVWKQNAGADYYLLNNEWDIGDLASGELINAFALECMKLADQVSVKLGILNFSGGCPSDDPVNGTPCSMEDRLAKVLPALSYAASHGHAVSVHVHTHDKGDLPKTGEAIALRHQRLLRYCRANGFMPKVLITELSNGVGGVEPNAVNYLAALRWWDRAVQNSPFAVQVIGGALYGFNAAETLTPIVPQLVQLMQESGTTPDPVTDPIVRFQGSCLESRFETVAERVVQAGGTIARLA